MVNPWPVPFPTPLVVKNGSKILSLISSGIPVPVSETRISAQPSDCVVLMGNSSFAVFPFLNGMSRVDDQVNKHLVDFAGQTADSR